MPRGLPLETEYGFINNAEEKLLEKTTIPAKTGTKPTEKLPREIIDVPVSIAIPEVPQIEEGAYSMEDIMNIYNEQNKDLNGLMSTESFEELLGEIDEDGDMIVTITEKVDVPKTPETGVEAIGYYLQWLNERNEKFSRGLDTKSDKNRSIATWAAIRTLGKNEYIETISELMEDNPQELRNAVEAIQFISTAQLKIEGQIVKGTTSEFMGDRDFSNATGALTKFLTKSSRGERDEQIFELLKNQLPNNESYLTNYEALKAGTLTEAKVMREFEDTINEDMSEWFEGEVSIEHSDSTLERSGVDIVVTGKRSDGRTTKMCVDVKLGDKEGIFTLQNGNAVDKNGNAADPYAYNIQKKFVSLIDSKEEMFGVIVRISNRRDIESNDLEKDLQPVLRKAFA